MYRIHIYDPHTGERTHTLRGRKLSTLNRYLGNCLNFYRKYGFAPKPAEMRVYRKNKYGKFYRFSVRRWLTA